MDKEIKRDFDENGNLLRESEYLSGKLHGRMTFWNKEEKIAEGEFREGKLHGVSREWYINGNIQVINHYINGLREGKYCSWWENGNKKEEGFYSKGQRTGKYTWFDMDGSIIKEYVY